jgi:hypothetical protein
MISVTVQNSSSRIIRVSDETHESFISPSDKRCFEVENEDDFKIATIRNTLAYYGYRSANILFVEVVDNE